ncbi:hypothetical protein VTH82DRAFT_6623 [Thermothelomyces myriococcoides]
MDKKKITHSLILEGTARGTNTIMVT